MAKRTKNKKHCGNCDNRNLLPVGDYFHESCKYGLGEVFDPEDGRKCVCKWVENKSKPRGCFKWTRR